MGRFHLRPILTACLACLSAALAACGTGSPTSPNPAVVHTPAAAYDPLAPAQPLPLGVDNVKLLPGASVAGRTVVAATALDTADTEVQDALVLVGVGGGLAVSLDKPLQDAVFYVRYDAAREHFTGSSVTDGELVSLVHDVEPGLVAIGLSATTRAGLPTGAGLVNLRFAPGAAAPRTASLITSNVRAKVDDLTAVDNGDTSATLQWSERHPGDYDLNGEVNAADITRIGQHFKETYTAADPGFAQIEVIDGDANTEINSADITVIGQSFKSFITGYNLYRTPLATPTETPDPAETARWTKVDNVLEPTGPSSPRDYNGQDFRLVSTFLDQSTAGDYGWFVRPTGPNAGDLGTISAVVTLTVGPGAPPDGGLSFDIMPPQGPAIAVGNDIYIGVKITGALDLFSANVRFEYDASLLQFVEAVPAYNDGTDHPNLLTPPLFVGADDVGNAASPYRLLGFNATQTLGTPVVNGDGYLGYIHFTALALGVNTEAIRFPQTTSFIYLWGDQYGVPCMTPTLGPPVMISVL
jgi:hypothetical protein